jgi:hypothetical protein
MSYNSGITVRCSNNLLIMLSFKNLFIWVCDEVSNGSSLIEALVINSSMRLSP